MDKLLLKKYTSTRNKREALEDVENELKALIVKEMKKEKVEKAETAYGIFTIAKKTNYTYTEKIKELEEKVKISKLKEVQQGLVTESVTEFLRFTELKTSE